MNKLNQILFIALILQIALISVSVVKTEDRGITEPTALYPDFDKATAKSITVTGGDLGNPKMEPLTVGLSKEGSTWVIDGTESFPADAEKVSKILDAVDSLTAAGAVVNKSSYYKKLEVLDTYFGRKLKIEHEGEPLEFLLGSSPSLNRRHLRKVGAEEVFVVTGLDTWDIGVRRGEWASKEYVEIPDKEVWAVTIDNPKGRIQIERGPNDEWALLGAPPTKKVKATDVAALVRRVRSVPLDEPLGKTDKPGYGLGKPTASISLITGTSTIAGVPPQSTKTVRWFVGAPGTDGTHYVKAEDQSHYVRVKTYNLQPFLEKTTADYLED